MFSVYIILQTIKSSRRLSFQKGENLCWCKMITPTYNAAPQKRIQLELWPVGDADSNWIIAMHVRLRHVHSDKMVLSVSHSMEFTATKQNSDSKDQRNAISLQQYIEISFREKSEAKKECDYIEYKMVNAI